MEEIKSMTKIKGMKMLVGPVANALALKKETHTRREPHVVGVTHANCCLLHLAANLSAEPPSRCYYTQTV